MARTTSGLAIASCTLVASVAMAIPALAAPPASPVRVLATGLEAPSGVRFIKGGVYVAEQGTGAVGRIDRRTGDVTTIAEGISSPASVDAVGRDLLIVTRGDEPPVPGALGRASLLLVDGRSGATRVLADFEAYELRANPDGQRQFDAQGQLLDALSNPFSVLAGRGSTYAFVADAGANAVLAVDRDGGITNFFIPPVITSGACTGMPNNDSDHAGCDVVPTRLAYGPGNTLYVSMFSGAPGQGLVYVLDARTGEVQDVLGGFTGPTGVAVAPDGTVYVSEVLEGAPTGVPGPDFSPATVGQIVRVPPDGQRTTAQVTMPAGLDWHGGVLYSSSWTVAGAFGMAGAGQVVAVSPAAFE